MEIDHIFICTEKKAPAGELLKDFGLTEGTSNTHPGQGTACRRFFFHNMMLELLWVDDENEVQNERTKPMRLLERCLTGSKEVSPFGIAFRPIDEPDNIVPFAVWDYHPVYLPYFLKMQVAKHTPLSEPLYVYLSFAHRQDRAPIEKRQPMEHRISLNEVTSVNIHINQDMDLSEAAIAINRMNNISIKQDKEHFIELEFDNGVLGQCKDFRPNLPLVFKW